MDDWSYFPSYSRIWPLSKHLAMTYGAWTRQMCHSSFKAQQAN
jgi:hypothetical protein